MANTQAIQEALLKAVDTIVTQRNNELELDKTITAIVKKNLGLKNNNKPVYRVQYSGGFIDAVCQNVNDIYLPNTSVYVLIPQGNFSKEKIIIGPADFNDTQEKTPVVNIANSYAKIGKNLLSSNEDISYGLHSWHEKNNLNDSETSHQYQYIYQKDNQTNLINFDQESLTIFKDDILALMVQADFQTNLAIEQKQKAEASYGLIFNFIYDTLNKGYGETNGEIFDNLAPIVSGQIYNKQLEQWETQNLLYYDNKVTENDFSSIDVSTILIYIDNIESIYSDFIINSKESDTQWIQDLVVSYLKLLNQLADPTINSLDRKNLHETWRNTKVGDPSYRYEQYILDSTNMTGNPFSFNQWNTQKMIFTIDSSSLNNLDSILFFQEGFNENYENEIIWPLGNPGGPDILVKNIQLYGLKNASNVDEYTLKVEPYNKTNAIIEDLSNDELEFKATFLRQSYEDLTTNNYAEFYWFKESSSTINFDSEGYSNLAGIGWKMIDPTSSPWILSLSPADNQAQKNNYKCIVKYNEIIVEYIFSVYKKIATTEIKLESDLGTEFVFNIGNPTITVKIKDEYNEDFKEIGFNEDNRRPNYKYNWCIIDDNNNKIFLNESAQNILTRISQQTSLINVETKTLLQNGNLVECNNPNYATRISYPATNINNYFTIICYVQKKEIDRDNYYDIGSAELILYNTKNNIDVADYRIELINDDQVFKYDVYGKTPLNDNDMLLEIKPLQVRFLTANGIEINPENYEVDWVFPEDESTLLIPRKSTKYGCSFEIKKNYDPDCYNNQITCHIRFAGKHFYKDSKFYFGKEGDNGSNGTDIIVKIEYAKEDDYNNILNKEPLTLYSYKNSDEQMVSFINTDIKRVPKTSELFFENPKASNQDNFSTPIFKTCLYQKSEKIDFDVVPVYVLAGNRTGKGFSTGDSVLWINQEKIRSNSVLPLIQNIRAEIKLNNEETYYAFVSIPIIEYEAESLTENNLISIDKKYYLNSVVYNADGRNPIYNHNQGLKLNLPDSVATVEYVAKGGYNKQKISEKQFVYYESEPCFSLLVEKESKDKKQILTKTGKDKDLVYILPNDIYNGSVTNNRIEAWCYDSENNLIAIVYAPINMTLNTFGLASLNAWDGNSVTIDNDGGYVMAPQIGAGEKDSNNRFTGILMGKTETYTGGVDTEKQVGLFGYSCGLQSIFLDAESGNATFGLPDGYTIKTSNGFSIPVTDEDNYGEGRIELRPGGESKIGGWKIGRQSLYYTLKPSPIYEAGTQDISGYWEEDGVYTYSYSGEIGQKYVDDQETPQNQQYATHHKKDINVHDAGILLSSSPPYISIVGTMLTQTQVDNNINGYLDVGDSLELQLDPQTPTVFTIFRHNSEFRKQAAKKEGHILGDRTFLAGINARGQLQANIIGTTSDANRQASMYFGLTKKFNQPSTDLNEYMGAIFEAGTNSKVESFLKLIVNKDELASDSEMNDVYLNVPNNLYIEYNQGTTTIDVNDILRIYDGE